MTASTIKTWCWIHKWSSLVSTAFLLLLCVTGLPLIFHHEIDELLGNAAEPRDLPAGTPHASLDGMVKAALDRFPGQVVQYVVWERDEPVLGTVYLAKSLAFTRDFFVVTFDARTAEILKTPRPTRRLHAHHVPPPRRPLTRTCPGKLFLGSMGLLLLVAIVSGAVIYHRFMRRLDFGTVRARLGSARVRWLDLHNLLGVVTLAWLTVVGVTGVFNTTADLVLRHWRTISSPTWSRPTRAARPLERAGSLDAAVATGLKASPGMIPFWVAFPGTVWASPHHYAIFFRGDNGLVGASVSSRRWSTLRRRSSPTRATCPGT